MYIARFSYDVQHVHRQQAFTLCNSLPPCPLSVVAVARTCGRWSRYEGGIGGDIGDETEPLFDFARSLP